MKKETKTIKKIIALGLIVILLAVGFLGRKVYLDYRKEKLVAYAKEHRQDSGMVVFGDSIWDLNRGDNGMADLVKEGMGGTGDIYNLSIRGTRATEDDAVEQTGINLSDIVDMIENGTNSIPSEYEASAVLDRLNTEHPYIRYAVIAYGLNDYFLGVRMENPVKCFDPESYAGSLRTNIERVYGLFPGVTIILAGPTFCVGYNNGTIDHDSDSFSYGGGTLLQYNEVARKVAGQYGMLFVDNYTDLGVDRGNSSKYLADGTHFTELGRRTYADHFLYRLAQQEYAGQ
ncbi:MAG: SGNH/GDSL hydrolase family protein [Lachnospiraceae bacterium]|nr:SGNH/GDSL hydrolase family protein [Lachnospiraceae bacterium]